MKKKLLTEKERKFADAVITGKNLKESAIEAGYKPTSAIKLGSRMMKVPHVRQAIDEARKELSKQSTITALTIMDTLWEMVVNNKDSEKEIAIKAIVEINKMQGNYAPEKTVNVNLTDEDALNEIRKIREAYKKEY